MNGVGAGRLSPPAARGLAPGPRQGRSAPLGGARTPSGIGEEPPNRFHIRPVHGFRLAQITFSFRRFFRQDVTLSWLVASRLTGARNLETLGCAAIALEFRHTISPLVSPYWSKKFKLFPRRVIVKTFLAAIHPCGANSSVRNGRLVVGRLPAQAGGDDARCAQERGVSTITILRPSSLGCCSTTPRSSVSTTMRSSTFRPSSE